MKKKFCVSILILFLLSIFSPFLISQNPPLKTEIKPATPTQEAKKEPEKKEEEQTPKDSAKNPDDVTWRDILDYNRKANDKTLATITHFIQVIGIVIAIVGLGIAIAGFIGVRKIYSLKKELNKKLIEANRCSDNIKETQKAAEKANNRITLYLDNMSLKVQEAQKRADELSKIDYSSEISNTVKSQLNEFAKNTDFAEYGNIKLKPEDHMARGGDFFLKGLYENALAECEKAIELKSDYPRAWNNKGAALSKLRRYSEALKAFEKAIELSPKDASFWKHKGTSLFELKRYQEAISAYETAINLNPKDPDPWFNKGIVLSALNNHPEALAAYENVLKIESNSPEAFFNRGNSLHKINRHLEALTSYEKAIQLKPTFPEAWFNKGIVLGELNRYSDALSAYNESIKLNPNNSDTFYNIACLYSRQSNKTDMLINLMWAIEKDQKIKEKARSDEDFRPYWDDPDFKRLVEDEAGAIDKPATPGK